MVEGEGYTPITPACGSWRDEGYRFKACWGHMCLKKTVGDGFPAMTPVRVPATKPDYGWIYDGHTHKDELVLFNRVLDR